MVPTMGLTLLGQILPLRRTPPNSVLSPSSQIRCLASTSNNASCNKMKIRNDLRKMRRGCSSLVAMWAKCHMLSPQTEATMKKQALSYLFLLLM